MGRGKSPQIGQPQAALSSRSSQEPGQVQQLRVKAHQLRRGDKLVPTAREVFRLHQAGIDIPSNKVEVVFTNRKRAHFGKQTEITIERAVR